MCPRKAFLWLFQRTRAYGIVWMWMTSFPGRSHLYHSVTFIQSVGSNRRSRNECMHYKSQICQLRLQIDITNRSLTYSIWYPEGYQYHLSSTTNRDIRSMIIRMLRHSSASFASSCSPPPPRYISSTEHGQAYQRTAVLSAMLTHDQLSFVFSPVAITGIQEFSFPEKCSHWRLIYTRHQTNPQVQQRERVFHLDSVWSVELRNELSTIFQIKQTNRSSPATFALDPVPMYLREPLLLQE